MREHPLQDRLIAYMLRMEPQVCGGRPGGAKRGAQGEARRLSCPLVRQLRQHARLEHVREVSIALDGVEDRKAEDPLDGTEDGGVGVFHRALVTRPDAGPRRKEGQ